VEAGDDAFEVAVVPRSRDGVVARVAADGQLVDELIELGEEGAGDVEDVLGVVADVFDVLDDGHEGEHGGDVGCGPTDRGVHDQLPSDLLDELVHPVVGGGHLAA
jgi:hypothetical protein